MFRAIKEITLFSLCLILAGCVNTEVNNNSQTPQHNWKTKAERISHTDTIYFANGSSQLRSCQKAKLRRLFTTCNLDWPFYSRIFINSGDCDKGNSLANARIKAIRTYLECLGVKNYRNGAKLLTPIESAQLCLKDNAAIVSIDQYRLVLPECPEWVQKPGGDFELPKDNNFGCLSERNMAFMIAEPRELYEAQAREESDGPRNKLAVETYRTKPIETKLAEALTIKSE